jgi:hypothetical protein
MTARTPSVPAPARLVLIIGMVLMVMMTVVVISAFRSASTTSRPWATCKPVTKPTPPLRRAIEQVVSSAFASAQWRNRSTWTSRQRPTTVNVAVGLRSSH